MTTRHARVRLRSIAHQIRILANGILFYAYVFTKSSLILCILRNISIKGLPMEVLPMEALPMEALHMETEPLS